MRNRLAIAILLSTVAVNTVAIAAEGDFDRALQVRQLAASIGEMAKAGPSQLDSILAAAKASGMTSMPAEAPVAPAGGKTKAPLKIEILPLGGTAPWATPLAPLLDQVATALPTNPTALVIEAGTATLNDIAARLYPSLTQLGAVALRINLPIVIAPGALLQLRSGDSLVLDGASGAFLINEGTLISDGGAVAGNGANTGLSDFRPFVLTLSPGSAQIADTSFVDLGFVGAGPYNGVGFLNQLSDPASSVRRSWFDNVASLSAQGSGGFVVDTSLFNASAGPAISIEGGDAASVRGNIILNPSQAEGIRVTASGSGTVVAGNIVLGTPADGINIDHGIGALEVAGNLVALSTNSGLSIDGASCIHVAGNWLVSNGDNGLAIRDSLAADVDDNVMASNGAAGLLIGDQPLLGQIAFLGNDLANNKVGISAKSQTGLRLANNDIADQTRLFGQALREFTTAYLDGGGTGTETLLGVATSPDLASGMGKNQICAAGEGV